MNNIVWNVETAHAVQMRFIMHSGQIRSRLLYEEQQTRWQTLPLTFSLAPSGPGRHTTLEPGSGEVFGFFYLYISSRGELKRSMLA